MSHALARQAIEAKLGAWAEARLIAVEYDNEEFTPPAGQVYLRAFLLPASTSSRYLGGDANEYRGIYQVSIVCPAGEPLATAEALIDELDGLFPVDSDLIQGAARGMIIEPVAQGPTIKKDTTYTVPASFTYLVIA